MNKSGSHVNFWGIGALFRKWSTHKMWDLALHKAMGLVINKKQTLSTMPLIILVHHGQWFLPITTNLRVPLLEPNLSVVSFLPGLALKKTTILESMSILTYLVGYRIR